MERVACLDMYDLPCNHACLSMAILGVAYRELA